MQPFGRNRYGPNIGGCAPLGEGERGLQGFRLTAYVFYDFTFCLSVLFSLFCKHVRLSCVFLNKLTLL